MFVFFITCFKDREAEADRTDKAEAGPATRTSPAGNELAFFFTAFLAHTVFLCLFTSKANVFCSCSTIG